MPQIKNFDRNTVRLFGEELQNALKGLAEKYGVSIKSAGATFARDGGNVTYKVAVAVIGEGGVAETKERSAFIQLAVMYGLQPTDLGKTFVHVGETVEITGLAPKSRKFPILGKKGGKTYKFPVEAVKAGLAKANPKT